MAQRYAVIGAGLMGVGIALCFARAGKAVLLVDTDPQRLAAIPGTAREILDELAEAGQFPAEKTDAALALLAGTQRLADIAACGLVIEAIPERLPLKHALYGELEAILPPDAVIASNTSGLTPDSLAEHMQHPERLLIAHSLYSAGRDRTGQRHRRAAHGKRPAAADRDGAGGRTPQPRRAGLYRQPPAVCHSARGAAHR